jgi:Cdc6-like AAA superfamily ATPase
MTTDPTRKIPRIIALNRTFTPARPVREAGLFAGRNEQIMECLSALAQPGLHLAVYGERGVGKTSLANVLPLLVREARVPHLSAGRVDCNTKDNFATLWQHAFRELAAEWDEDRDGDISPENVRFRLARDQETRLLVFDELDRLEDDDALSLLADTLKTLADHDVPTTLMLVGVAKSIDDLVGEHGSVVRSLRQIQMPRMQMGELVQILEHGYKGIGMSADREAVLTIAKMAQGLPHFVHLLGLNAGEIAVANDEVCVTMAHVEKAMDRTTSSHTILSEYLTATQSAQTGHLFEEVFLACAFAPKDALGYFRAADVRGPLGKILGRRVEIPAFVRHLNELSSDRRGYALQKEGVPRQFRYRFANPLLEPFARIMGVTHHELPDALLAEMRPDPEEINLFPDWPSDLSLPP